MIHVNVAELFDLGYGPWLIPLSDKIPAQVEWQLRDPVTPPLVQKWVDSGFNIGLRTGENSGVFVIDADTYKGTDWGHPTAPYTTTPRGGRHYYFKAPQPCPGCTTDRVARHVDTRGEGGYIVFPGTKLLNGGIYAWGPQGPIPIADLPKLDVDVSRKATIPPSGAPITGYTAKALLSEASAVRNASEGSRNDTLNRAAFNLGQLVAGGAIAESEVVAELQSAAQMAGLSERETQATIASGLKAGSEHPRSVPEPTKPGTRAPTVPAERARARKYILVPGGHVTPHGEYVEQSTAEFSEDVLKALPPGTIYRRAGTIGEIRGATFTPISAQRARSIIDAHSKLGDSEERGKVWEIAYRTCNKDLAALVIAYAEAAGEVRQLDYLATHPVYVESTDGLELATPGWNPGSNTFLTEAVPNPLPIQECREILDDLVCDFPFDAQADRENLFGLMLTPIMRPAIGEPVPLHLVNSPIERTGKTKLIEIVFGCSVLGHPTPATQLGFREDEREKRIMATLLSGSPVIHLDNVADILDSPALASLITAITYYGRILGGSVMCAVPNTLTLVASGNNVRASAELAKRTVPILLMPEDDAPERRTGFRHPQLKQYCLQNRPRTLAALIGLVENWRQQGCPMFNEAGFGGFERWTATVGGIMRAAGYDSWMSNAAIWRGVADDFTAQAKFLVGEWHAEFGEDWVPFKRLYLLAEKHELFVGRATSDHGRRTNFGSKFLRRASDRPIGGYRVRVRGRGITREARLEPLG